MAGVRRALGPGGPVVLELLSVLWSRARIGLASYSMTLSRPDSVVQSPFLVRR